MIVKILGSAGLNFHGVQYNDKKVEKGTGERMLMQNFPSFINVDSGRDEVRDYFKTVSKSEKVKKPQFHAVISTKFQNHGKEELTATAAEFMKEMGYGTQPYIVVFHSDTENNHVHVISTRVDRQTGKKINDSYERLKAQKALTKTLEKLYGVNLEEKLEKLMSYHYSSMSQLELLLERNGFKLTKKTIDEKAFSVLKNGVKFKTIEGNQIRFTPSSDKGRSRQLKAVLSKYKDLCSNQVFKVVDKRAQKSMVPEERHSVNCKPKVEFESELQKKLRDIFGLDLIFHHKEGQKPLGYSIIDHRSRRVYKGSEVMKMGELFQFTDEEIDKQVFESLKDFNLTDRTLKQALTMCLQRNDTNNTIKEFMLFGSRKFKNEAQLSAVREDVKDYVRTQKNENVQLIKSEDRKFYAIHTKIHYVGELEQLIGAKAYRQFLHPERQDQPAEAGSQKLSREFSQSLEDLIFEYSRSSGANANDPGENELKKRKKRRK